MFGTFRQRGSHYEHVELSKADGLEARGYTRVACNLCRTRKLKCSGNKNGCRRCVSLKAHCTYPTSPLPNDGIGSNNTSGTDPELRVATSSSSALPIEKSRPTKNQARQDPTPSAPVELDPETLPSTAINTSRLLSPEDCFSNESTRSDIFGANSTLFAHIDGPDFIQGLELASEKDLNCHDFARLPFDDGPSPTDESDVSLSSTWTTISPVSSETLLAHVALEDPDCATRSGMSILNGGRMSNVHQTSASGPSESGGGWVSGNVVNEYATTRVQSEQAGHNVGTHNDYGVTAQTPVMRPLELSPGSTSSNSKRPVANMHSSSQSSTTSNSQHTDMTRRTSLTGTSYSPSPACQCLRRLAEFLEFLGNINADEAAIDLVLISLERGIKICDEVLGCSSCTICTEYGIVVATVGQQLALTAEGAARKLITYDRQGNHRSSNRNLLSSSVTFGRCQIGDSEMLLSLTQCAVRVQVTKVGHIVHRLKERTLRAQGAWKDLERTESRMTRLHDLLRPTTS